MSMYLRLSGLASGLPQASGSPGGDDMQVVRAMSVCLRRAVCLSQSSPKGSPAHTHATQHSHTYLRTIHYVPTCSYARGVWHGGHGGHGWLIRSCATKTLFHLTHNIHTRAAETETLLYPPTNTHSLHGTIAINLQPTRSPQPAARSPHPQPHLQPNPPTKAT